MVRHHVQLSVLDGDEVLFLERLSAPRAVINVTQVAGRLPLNASSSGLVLLAHASDEQRDRVLAVPLKRYTPTTPTDPQAVRAALTQIRRNGYVVCPGYIHEDATGIAVPIRDRHRKTVAAVSVIVPRSSPPQAHIQALQATAHGIERALRTDTVPRPTNGMRREPRENVS